MTDETSFYYETLQLPSHIRLVELLPSENIDDDISCRMRIVDIDELPLYEAVSYVWGSETDKAEILCGGLALQVPRNLTAAFRRFRRSTTPRLLWADSICINQANTLEKNHQVRIMGRIFASASTVLIWLGEAEEEYSKSFVQGLNKLIELRGSGRLDELNQDLLATRPRDKNGDSIHDLINILLDTRTDGSTELKAFRGIFTRGWFRRAWTFQESFLANDRRVFLGSLEIAAVNLQVALYALGELYESAMLDHSPWLEPSDMDIMHPMTMLLPRDAYEHVTLRDLMRHRRGCECKHAVDLVYSLLGVTRDTKSIVPGYTKDFPQVFAEAMMVMIRADGNLAALGEVEIVPRSTTSELPTWIPDWRIPEKEPGVLSLSTQLFSCTGTTKPTFSISSDSRNLTISGFVIDSIRELLLPLEAWNRLEAQEDMGAAWVRVLCCDLDTFFPRNASAHGKRWDQSTYEMYDAMNANLVQSYRTTSEFSAAFVDIIGLGAAYKRVMTTGCERKGIAPSNAEPGDLVTVLFGGQVPVLLRPTANTNEFLFVGECYVDQMMDGEAMEQLANIRDRAARNNMTRLLKDCSATDTDLACNENANLQLYRVRDFVLV